MLKVIKGGAKESPEDIEKKLNERWDQMNGFVSHMRVLENSINNIKNAATKIDWIELDSKLNDCHNQILDTLSYVKNSSKMKRLKAEKKKADYLNIIE